MCMRCLLLILLIQVAATANATLLSSPAESRHGEIPLQLQSLHIHGEIVGSMAETSVRMVFFNPNPDALAGRLPMSLAQGQQIAAFALDTGSVIRPALLVPKAKGRADAQACQGNAAVLKQTPDNNLMLLVCAIAPMKTRMIELTFMESMKRDGKAWIYHLPPLYEGVVPDVRLSVNIRGSGDVPTVSGAFGSPRLDRDARGYFFHITEHDFIPNGELLIQIPSAQHTLTYTQKRNGETYFITEIPGATAPHSLRRGIHAKGATAVLMDFTDAQQGWVRVVGKLDAASATLKIPMMEQDGPKDRNITIASDAPWHPMAAHWWAACRLRELESVHASPAAMRALETLFTILRRDTLLVLPDQ
jgi:hypothetical protein